MLIEWHFGVCSLRIDELVMVLGVLLLVDAPRYADSVLLMALWAGNSCLNNVVAGIVRSLRLNVASTMTWATRSGDIFA